MPPGGLATPSETVAARASRVRRTCVATSRPRSSSSGRSRSSRTCDGSSPATPRSEPAAATAAPAGRSPTSSDPVTWSPLAARLPPHRGHDLVQRRCPPVLDVEAHLDVSGTRQPEPERADTGEAAVALAHGTRHLPRGVEVVALEVDVERDQRRPCADEHTARPLVELRRAEVRDELARRRSAAAAPPGRRAGRRPGRARREVGVEEDRQRELLPDPPCELERRGARALGVPLAGSGRAGRRPRRRCGDARPRDGAGRSARARTAIPASSAATSSSSLPTSVYTDRLWSSSLGRRAPRVRRERLADRVDRRAVAPLGEVRDGLERQHRGGPYAPAR